ncbi:MAG: tryptophan--tRNA ligase [Clostridia bacterium]|nr:tryptophan--tRNA ligase [Clostridia bacterium]
MEKTIFSGIQPSGIITLGNYIGAVRNWSKVSDQGKGIFSVVDLHAITVRQDPKELHERILSTLALIIASGVDPEKNLIFIQSHVPEHCELSWILNCYTMFGELSRMTQFKDKSQRYADNINAGLFDYPVLMAADILLYDTDLVPVGVDQKQHLELARNIAVRMNGVFPDLFTVPEGYIPSVGAKVMSLTQPDKKMSKSDPNPKSYISVLDEPAKILKKCKSAVTDSENRIAFEEGRYGMNNLLTIYSAMTGETIEDTVKKFEGQGYGTFKTAVAEAIIEGLAPLQEEYKRLMADPAYLRQVYTRSAAEARQIAAKTLARVHERIGFVGR